MSDGTTNPGSVGGPSIIPRAHNAATITNFMRRVEQMLLFRIELKELLCGGPPSLSKIGSCFLAVYSSNPAPVLETRETEVEIM